ncbi:hypothetical protein [Crassaminicella profunda]|uniref:hypothetical protein n=1 Tax=Crassaminicella profunda TaxID=1286698 RepID=UPI001CA75BE8|nr:hypothetical protein [Crassaminicella profunda]QZY57212.1 hypothetical protein K7H06_09955 [Crassaminicella profunda]
MKVANLPDQTRMELYNHMKKNIRKYYKGLKNGSLKYDFFVKTILSKNPKPNWLSAYPKLENDIEFQNYLIEYIKKEIIRYAQLEKTNHCNHSTCNIENITIRERHELKTILNNHGYALSIPAKFITCTESNYLKEYVLNGTPIPFEWEKILNYIKRTT